MLESKKEERLKEIRDRGRYDTTELRSKTYNRMRLNEDIEKTIKEEEEDSKRKMIAKRQEYGNLIYVQHPPVVSQKKREEMK